MLWSSMLWSSMLWSQPFLDYTFRPGHDPLFLTATPVDDATAGYFQLVFPDFFVLRRG